MTMSEITGRIAELAQLQSADQYNSDFLLTWDKTT